MPFPKIPREQRRAVKWQLTILAAITFLLSAAAIYLADYWHKTRIMAAQRDATNALAFQIEHFLLHHHSGIAFTLAKSPEIIDLAAGRTRADNEKILIALTTARRIISAGSDALIYVMDQDGTVQACTPYDNGKTLTGNNYWFRPYFILAMKGRDVTYPALGVTTNKRGLYFSTPVSPQPDGPPRAVLVIKLAMTDVDELLRQYGHPALLLSPDGIVFAASEPDWLFRAALPLSDEKLVEIRDSRQFADKRLPPLPFSLDHPTVQWRGRAFTVFSSPLPIKGWRVATLQEDDGGYPLLTVFIILLGLLCLAFFMGLSLVTIKHKRLLMEHLKKRHAELTAANQRLEQEIVERQAAEQGLRTYQEKLEDLVGERTSALAAANAKLEQQIAESARAEEKTKTASTEKKGA